MSCAAFFAKLDILYSRIKITPSNRYHL